MSTDQPTGEYEFRAIPIEDIRYEFEKAFRKGQSPRIEAFLQGEGPDRLHLLIELIHSELELRLRAGQPAELAEYLARYPALVHFPNELANLLATEIQLRQLSPSPPELSEYERKYPHLGGRVRDLFRKIGSAPPDVPGYEIQDKIAEGGMGVVYKARQILLRRDVAIKLIRQDRLTEHSTGERFQSRFRREAEAIATVNHPHIVQIFETGAHGEDLFIAMELVDGESLQKRLNTIGVLTPHDAAVLFEKIARAIHAVHERKIIHRDLKPDNILVNSLGEPKVADFGLARSADVSDGKTKAGVLIGTPEYISPEQASLRGEAPTPLVDVYGLGATLYACLTGRPPFPRESVLVTLEKVRTLAAVPIRQIRPDCPRDLEIICAKCLEKEPAKRYPSAAAMADDLHRWLAGQPIVARSVGRVEKSWKWMQRNPVVTGLLAAVFMVMATGTVTTYVKYLDARTQEAKAKEKTLEAESKGDLAREKTAEAKREAEDRKLAFIGYTLTQARDAWSRGDAAHAHEFLDAIAAPDRDWAWHLLNNWFDKQAIVTRTGPRDVHEIYFDTAAKRMYLRNDLTSQVWNTETWTVVIEEQPNEKPPAVEPDRPPPPLQKIPKTKHDRAPNEGAGEIVADAISGGKFPKGLVGPMLNDSKRPADRDGTAEKLPSTKSNQIPQQPRQVKERDEFEPGVPGDIIKNTNPVPPKKAEAKQDEPPFGGEFIPNPGKFWGLIGRASRPPLPKNTRFSITEENATAVIISDSKLKQSIPILVPEMGRGRSMLCGDGNYLVIETSVGKLTPLVCYKLPEGKEHLRLKYYEQSSLLLPSPMGRYLLCANRTSVEDHSPTANCIDLTSGAVLYTLNDLETPPIHEAPPLVLFSADDRHLFRNLDNNAIAVLRSDSGKEERKLVGHRAPVERMATTPDGNFLVTVGAESTTPPPAPESELVPLRPPTMVKVWDLRQTESGRVVVPRREKDPLAANLIPLDPKNNDPRFQAERFQRLHDLSPFPSSRPDVAKTVSTGIVHSAGWIVTGHKDGTVRVWRASDERLMIEVIAARQPIADVGLSGDGQRLAAICETVYMAKPPKKEDAKKVDKPSGGVGADDEFNIPGDHDSIYGESREVEVNGKLLVWDVSELRKANLVAQKTLPTDFPCGRGLQFSPTGKRIICGPRQAVETRWQGDRWHTFAVWNGTNDHLPWVFDYHTKHDIGFAPAWDAGDNRVAYGDKHGCVTVKQLGSDERAHKFVGHQGQVTGIAFHPTSPMFASIGADRTIQIFDPRLKTPLLKLPYRGGIPDGIRFLDAGRSLEVTDRDGGVVLYSTVATKP